MRTRLTLAAVLVMLAGGALVASTVAAAASPSSASTLRAWGRGHASTAPAETAVGQDSLPGATQLVVIAREVDFTIIDVGPRGDSPGDTIVFTDDLVDQAGRRIGRDQARCTIMFRDDVLCDASFVIAGSGQLLVHGVGLTFAVTGGTGEFRKARGQMQETFLPTGEFRFAFTLFL
jgi:hypothetical protein